jgi:predicted RNA-binding Zn-ribbon protein involved in translation (DUF1610 family)
MKCPYCDVTISDDSIYCSSCGKKLEMLTSEALIADTAKCPNCGTYNSNNSNYCTNCRTPLTDTAIAENRVQNELQMQQAQIKMQALSLKAQQEQLQLQREQYTSMAKCPRCGSTSLSGNKKGFGIGKAVIGAALVGPLGLVAGNVGAKKVQVTCLKCGKKFKV